MTDVVSDLPNSKVDIKCSKNDLDGILKRKAENRMKPVNKLPVDVLSRVFAIGEEEARLQRYPSLAMWKYTSFQELASHVCSRWRDIAINDPTLWTYIHITRPPSQLTSLYLDRAGPTTLLDVDISLHSRYWDSVGIRIHDTISQVKHIPDMLAAFMARGASFNRWKSLNIWTAQWEPLLSFIGMLNAQTAYELRLISWTKTFASRAIMTEAVESNFPAGQSYSLSGASLPNLSGVYLYGLPLTFLFHPPCTPLLGLRQLHLDGGSGDTPLPSKLREVLSACSQLEYLQLSSGVKGYQDTSGTIERVCLSSLRSLRIFTPSLPHWVVSILRIIDSPRLQDLIIHCPLSFAMPAGSDQIATYIATGKSPLHADRDPPTPSDPAGQLRYPSLRELDIAFYGCAKEEVVAMLSSLPLVTHLCICGDQAECLGGEPWVLPNLVTLKFTQLVYPHLGETLRNRAEAGLPIKKVQVHKDFELHVTDKLPETVEIELYFDGLFQRNYVEKSDEDDWEDDELEDDDDGDDDEDVDDEDEDVDDEEEETDEEEEEEEEEEDWGGSSHEFSGSSD